MADSKEVLDNLVTGLTLMANTIMRTDGDRDHMNQSNLNCEITQASARLMRYAVKALKALTATE